MFVITFRDYHTKNQITYLTDKGRATYNKIEALLLPTKEEAQPIVDQLKEIYPEATVNVVQFKIA